MNCIFCKEPMLLGFVDSASTRGPFVSGFEVWACNRNPDQCCHAIVKVDLKARCTIWIKGDNTVHEDK